MFGNIFNSQSRTITFSAIILVVSSVISKFLGVWRDWLLSAVFGAGQDLDIYYAAFRIPDFIYNILIAGGIVVAFLPLFSEYCARDKQEAMRFANNILNIFLVLLVLICSVLFVFATPLMKLITPGFDPAQLDKTVFLTRLMFLSPILFGVSSVFSGILQYFHRFLAYSLAPVLYNLGIIAGIWLLAPSFGILGAAVGVIGGAAMFFLVQVIPAKACGYRYSPVFDVKDPSVKRILGLMLPRTFGVAANQINLAITVAIASTLAAGSIAVFNLANNLFSFPVGIIGISFAIAAFPSFAKSFAELKRDEFTGNFSSVFRQIVYLVIPASLLMFLLRGQIVEVVYLHGNFTREAADLTAASLGLFCLGILAASLMPVVFRVFFAFQDTVTPTLTTVASVALNIFLNYYFIGLLAEKGFVSESIRSFFRLNGAGDISVIGLALAYSAANIFQFIVLAALLYRKDGHFVKTKEILISFSKVMIASLIMAVAVYFILYFINATTKLGAFFDAVIASASGIAVYAAATAVLKSSEIRSFKGMLLKAVFTNGIKQSGAK